MAADGLSIRGYAEHRRRAGLPGGTKNAVEKALAAGRISRTSAGRIDPSVADAEWIAQTTRPAAIDDDEADGAPEPGSGYAKRFNRARTIREEERAKLAALEYARAAGEAALVKPMRAEAHRIGRLVRERVLTVPDRVAALCAAESDPGAVRRLLLKELTAALTAIANE